MVVNNEPKVRLKGSLKNVVRTGTMNNAIQNSLHLGNKQQWTEFITNQKKGIGLDTERVEHHKDENSVRFEDQYMGYSEKTQTVKA